MKKIIFGIVFSVFALAMVIVPAFAANDKNNLTIGANLKEYKQPLNKDCDIQVPSQYITIQTGVDAANTGDTVCVEKGIYNEDVAINKSITLAGSGSKHTFIVGQTPGYGATLQVGYEASGTIVEGFTIIGVGPNGDDTAVLIGESLSNIILQYNHLIAGSGGNTLLAQGWQNNDLIQNNVIEGNNSLEVVHIGGLADPASKPSDKVDFQYNTLLGTASGNGAALSNYATNSLIMYNDFSVTGEMASMIYNKELSTSVINFNNFNSNSITLYGKVSNWGLGLLDARNNWWGDNGLTNAIGGNVDYIPFSTEPFLEFK